jgi:3-isopropylmalate dehydrogenase
MTALRIAVLRGDGIGPEIVGAALGVLRAAGVAFEEVPLDVGADRYLRDGHVLDDADLDLVRTCDAILKGPVGPPVDDVLVPLGTIERGIILKLRFDFDQYVNLRPFAGNGNEFVFVRENTEGSYAGDGGFLRKGTLQEVATQGSVNTRVGVERCVRYAFELAMSRPRRHLTLVHKTNVLTFAGDLWQRVFNIVKAEYPDVETAYQHVDAACIYLVEDPGRYDVVVTDNLFGDILTDLAGAVTGGVGFAGAANLNPDRTFPSMFEPVHGAAHDRVGTQWVNPSSQILSAIMLLEFVGEGDTAARIRRALAAVLADSPAPNTIGDLVAKTLGQEG